jgi:glutathione transport system permease protein
MIPFLGNRALQMVPTVLGVMIAVFFFVRALPGDPARLYAGQEATLDEIVEVRERFGLDSPLPEQFARYVAQTARGDLGVSFRANRPVGDVLLRHAVPTLTLAGLAIVMAIAAGLALGVAAALQRGNLSDLAITVISILGISTPSFFLGIVLIWVFAVQLGVLPVAGATSASGMVLPAITLAAASTGTIARFARSSFLEVLGEDFVRTARAKGLAAATIRYKHVLRNALIPVVTIIGLQFGFLLSGAIIVETVFSFPGLGWLLIESITARDYPVIQALLLVFSLQFLVINLIVDVTYAAIDPRVAHE